MVRALTKHAAQSEADLRDEAETESEAKHHKQDEHDGRDEAQPGSAAWRKRIERRDCELRLPSRVEDEPLYDSFSSRVALPTPPPIMDSIRVANHPATLAQQVLAGFARSTPAFGGKTPIHR